MVESIFQETQRQLPDLQKEIQDLIEKNRFVKFKKPDLIYDHQHHALWYNGEAKSVYYTMLKDEEASLRKKLGFIWKVAVEDTQKTLKKNQTFLILCTFNTNEYVYYTYNGDKIRLDTDDKVRVSSLYISMLQDFPSRAIFLPFAPLPKEITIWALIEGLGFLPAERPEPLYQKLNKLIQSIQGIQAAPGLADSRKGILVKDEELELLLKHIRKNGDSTTSIAKTHGRGFQEHNADWIKEYLLLRDLRQIGLNKLDETYLTDINKGLWELYSTPDASHPEHIKFDLPQSWESRNPEEDVREMAVAIDFGTSSTVVAYRDDTGKKKLIRIGIDDYFKPVEESHFENPTLLQFSNYRHLYRSWSADYFRPDTRWKDACCSHRAADMLKENTKVNETVNSILDRLKPWALRDTGKNPLRIIDTLKKQEVLIPHHQPQNTDKKTGDRFDPIEFYAYLLGLFINNRLNGIYLNYFMTFPVKYPDPIKQNILKSFSRGLHRSLPDSFSASRRLMEFSVQEIASEPVAYLASAAKSNGLLKNDDKINYAVFDFGGGTTDFAFGVFREAENDEVNLEGMEYIIEHFYSSGDTYLGGEYILENMAYLVFQDNLEVCRASQIPFDCPDDADPFPGSEAFLDNSSAAAANTTIMMGALRNYWHRLGEKKADSVESGIKSVKADLFFNRGGQTVTEKSELKINTKTIDTYVFQRVFRGITEFRTALKTAFLKRIAKDSTIHIFLAGNSCRSQLVQRLFDYCFPNSAGTGKNPPPRVQADTQSPKTDTITSQEETHPNILSCADMDTSIQNWLKEQSASITSLPYQFILHAPPIANDKDPYQPTCKTGIALGLLDIIPGEPIKVVDKQREKMQNQSPFYFFVGKYVREKFVSIIKQDDKYQQWYELGAIPNRAVNLVFSQAPSAGTGSMKRGDELLRERIIHFDKDTTGMRCFISISAPDKIKICAAPSKDQIVKSSALEIKLEL